MLAEPTDNFSGAFVRREYGIEDVLDVLIANDECKPLEEAHAGDAEGGQMQGIAECEGGVAENFKGQMEARGHFALIVGGLGA